MRVVTIGASPYLLSRNGKMNAGLLRQLKSAGHQVVSLVWGHDEGYFMPNMEGEHAFEEGGENICQLYPFQPLASDASVTAFEMLSQFKPQVVVSIGDHHEIAFISACKAMYPNLFRWLAILTIDSCPINEKSVDHLQYIDQAVCLTDFAQKELARLFEGKVDLVRPGPNKVFKNLNTRSELSFRVYCGNKNAHTSNLPAFIKTIGEADHGIRGYLHTNFFDPGDYDLSLLIERYKASRSLDMTEEFVSMTEGIPEDHLNKLYNKSHVVVDVSARSATAMTLLEGMAAGMVPVGVNYGAVGEIISMMPEEFRFIVPHITYVGDREEEFAIASQQKLKECITAMFNTYMQNRELFKEMGHAASKIAEQLSKKDFFGCIYKLVKDTANSEDTLVLKTCAAPNA